MGHDAPPPTIDVAISINARRDLIEQPNDLGRPDGELAPRPAMICPALSSG